MAASERGTRKLAAIMFTDIKSFSKKMSENESLAMELLRVHDDTLKAVIERFDGKIIKAIGDAFMVDFSSAVNAVKCAIEAQQAFYEYNKGKSELEKIEVRMGIHLGDVITDGNDIFGDGVNIAARIEAVTEPNRICISHDVYSQIRNKMQVDTYHMGSIELKNIPEPVEVYEILLSDIPEFAVPSKTAQQMPSRRAAEKTTKREAREAEKIEAAKRKSDEDRQKTERETQEKIGAFYAKAEQLVNEGKLKEAEAEINEIFKLVAFHAGAQVLQGRIDEERERKAEEERKGQAARKKIESRTSSLMQDALTMVEADNYPEALLKVREVLSIDANNQEAKNLESQILEAQKAIEELERQEAKEEEGGQAPVEEEEPGSPVSEPEPVPAEPPAQPPVPAAPTRPSVGLRPRRKRKLSPGIKKLIGAVAVGLLIVLFFPTIQNILFPRDTSIAIVPFDAAPGVSDTSQIGLALALILSEDFSQFRQIMAVRPRPDGVHRLSSRQIAQNLQSRHVLTGTIRSLTPRLVVTVRLELPETDATIWEKTVEADAYTPGPLRQEVVAAVLGVMEIETDPPHLPRLSGNPSLREPYLRAKALVSDPHYTNLMRGIDLLRQLVQFDTTFADASVALGRALLRQFRAEGERGRGLLREAADLAAHARSLNPDLPGIYEVLGSAYRAAGRYGAALGNLERSLELQPGNPETLRQLALLSLVEGKYDRGLQYASKAELLDPQSPETQETLGHMYYFKQQLNRSQTAYDQAIANGGNPFFITTRYKLAVWGAGLSPEPAVEYCSRLLRQDTTNYVLKYWIGRAYMLSGLWTQAKGYLESGSEHLRKLAELTPDDPEIRSYLALYYARLGESAKGLAEIDKAIDLTNQSALMMYRKAQFFAIQSGKKAEALEWLRAAVQKEYILHEVMNPDFAFVVKEPDFLKAISLRIPAPGED